MAVADRIAFALIFLSDNKLYEYLKRLTQKLIEEGDLAGFLLTGDLIIIYTCKYIILLRLQIDISRYSLHSLYHKINTLTLSNY